jgi:hypothetical protein
MLPIRVVATCVTCKKREEFDARLKAELDYEGDSYGRTTTSVVLSTTPELPEGWVTNTNYWDPAVVWCSLDCRNKDPYGRGRR